MKGISKLISGCFIFASILMSGGMQAHAKEVLTIWTSNEHVRDAIISAAKPFEKEYEVKVDVIILNKELTSQFKTAALSGKGPDIFVWAHDVAGELASSGLIAPVQISKKLQSAFLPVALNAFQFNGRYYGYPYDVEALALIYNKKLIKNPPQTFDELIHVSKKIQKENKGTYGFLYEVSNFFFSFPLLSADGGYVFANEKGKLNTNDVGLANKGAITGGNLIARLIKDGIIPKSTDRSIAFEKMKTGKLAMTIDGPWALSDLRKSGIDYGIAQIPTIAGQTPKPFVGVHGFFIRRSSKQQALAKELIENYLVSKEGILSLYKADPRGPARSDVLDSLNTDKDLQQFVQSAKNGVPMPNVPEMGVVWGAMGSALNLIIEDKRSPETALKSAVVQINEGIHKK